MINFEEKLLTKMFFYINLLNLLNVINKILKENNNPHYLELYI